MPDAKLSCAVQLSLLGLKAHIVLEAQHRHKSAIGCLSQSHVRELVRNGILRVCYSAGGCGATGRGPAQPPGSCLGGHRRSAAQRGVHPGVCAGVPATRSPQAGAWHTLAQANTLLIYLPMTRTLCSSRHLSSADARHIPHELHVTLPLDGPGHATYEERLVLLTAYSQLSPSLLAGAGADAGWRGPVQRNRWRL